MPLPKLRRRQTKPAPTGRRILTRNRASSLLLAVGSLTVVFGLLTAFSGFGLIFLVFSPLWFTSAAALRPTRVRIACAVAILACWFTGLGFVLA